LHCVTHATCPVVVVHQLVEDVRSPAHVVVGVDGSDESRAALAVALDEASRLGADVTAVTAYAPADYWTDLTTVVMPETEQIRSEIDRQSRRLVDEVLADRPEPRDALPTVRTEVHVGSPAGVLVEQARAAELLVVGSRGRGAFRGLLLGSVALHCAMRAPCPVMVVPAARNRAAGGTRSESAMATH
jgi:nucleotide-binding universal stress UspA family protein